MERTRKFSEVKNVIHSKYAEMRGNKNEFIIVKSLVEDNKSIDEINSFLELKDSLRKCHTKLYVNGMRDLNNITAEVDMYGGINLFNTDSNINFIDEVASKRPHEFIKLFNESKINKKLR